MIIRKEHYDVGLFGWWYNYNYGANLTYFALNRALRGLGKKVVMLWRSDDNLAEPRSVQMDFAKRYYHISPRVRFGDLQRFNELCDDFVLGSDQVWNPDLEEFIDEQFFFSFVEPSRRKIAYAQSFGQYRSLPEPYIARYKDYVSRFTKISVREDYAVETLKNSFGAEAEQVCDPVFLIEPSQYDELLSHANIRLPRKYVLDFILDPDGEKMQLARTVRSDLGIQDYVNFTDLDSPEVRVGAFLGERVEAHSRIENLVKAYKNADFVVTDSFHGTCLALLFNKPFISFANAGRGVGRFESLLRSVGLTRRMIYSISELHGQHREPIDFSAVNVALASRRRHGIDWLKSAFDQPSVIGKPSSVEGRLDTNRCVGCSACQAVCPVHAITLRPDKWGYYIRSVDGQACLDCGQCARICPELNPQERDSAQQPECYAFISADDETLRRSSSGGVFATLAREAFSRGGAVVGAAWTSELTVEHIVIDREKDLWKLQKSKYLQSSMGSCLQRVKELLTAGRFVLFTGTPCQVAGLQAYLGKDYKNLLTVDIFCSYTPSAEFFKKYLESSCPPGVRQYEFRHKRPEWNWDCTSERMEDAAGRVTTRSEIQQDDFQRVFHSHVMCPPHCEACHYQNIPRSADLTMGDFWGIAQRDPDIPTKKGVSVVLVNSSKGRAFFLGLPDSSFQLRKKMPLSAVGGNGFTTPGSKNYAPATRDTFFSAILQMPFREAVNYSLKPNHGQFRAAYAGTGTPLRLDATMLHFRFEPDVWEEHLIDGRPTLIVREEKWRENGHYARLPMAGMLRSDRRYRMSVKYRVHSRSDILNFHVIDSGSRTLQIVRQENIAGQNNGDQWIEFSEVFTPNTDFYDEFMVGAAQISGPGNFLTFAYIDISEA